MAIDYADRGPGANIREIEQAADAINHVIPSHGELESSFNQLIARELVGKNGKRYSLSPAGHTLLAQARDSDQSGTVMGVWQTLSRDLPDQPTLP